MTYTLFSRYVYFISYNKWHLKTKKQQKMSFIVIYFRIFTVVCHFSAVFVCHLSSIFSPLKKKEIIIMPEHTIIYAFQIRDCLYTNNFGSFLLSQVKLIKLYHCFKKSSGINTCVKGTYLKRRFQLKPYLSSSLILVCRNRSNTCTFSKYQTFKEDFSQFL